MLSDNIAVIMPICFKKLTALFVALFVPASAFVYAENIMDQIDSIEKRREQIVSVWESQEEAFAKFYEQFTAEKHEAVSKIRNAPFQKDELEKNGVPKESVRHEREVQVFNEVEKAIEKFHQNCDAEKAKNAPLVEKLHSEMEEETKNLTQRKTQNTLNGSFMARYSEYENRDEDSGWPVTLGIYGTDKSGNEKLYWSRTVMVTYDVISKSSFARNSFTKDFEKNKLLVNQKFSDQEPVVYFDVDYEISTVTEENYLKYKIYINKISIRDSLNDRILSERDYTDGRGFDYGKETLKYSYIVLNEDSKVLPKSEEDFAKYRDFMNNVVLTGYLDMVQIPKENFEAMKTEVTLKLYEVIFETGYPETKSRDLPLRYSNWKKNLEFCNKLSMLYGFTPVYSYNGETDPDKWELDPGYFYEGPQNIYDWTKNSLKRNYEADGFRLPVENEWVAAAKGGKKFKYNGRMSVKDEERSSENDRDKWLPPAQNKPNGYGLYDMFGSMFEMGQELIYEKGRGCSVRCYDPSDYYTKNYDFYEESVQNVITTETVGIRLFRTVAKQ